MLANAITLSRLLFLALSVYLLTLESVTARAAAFFLIIFTLLIDAFDGLIARHRGSADALGAVLDIAIDRVVENVFWITFVSLELVPLWVALVVVTRGILTDAVRGFALGQGMEPFKMMRTRWGQILVSHRFMRALYGTAKAITFPALALVHTLQLAWVNEAAGSVYAGYLALLEAVTFALVLITVTMTILRGVPVLVEARHFFIASSSSAPTEG
jgi:phosphatidylglycerophosphate synthase